MVPIFRAVVEGQNFLFLLDNEPQHLDFHRSICLEAECLDSASEQAIRYVREELHSHDNVKLESDDSLNVSLAYIEQVDVHDDTCTEQGFIWYFPEDAVFEHKLKH